MECGALSDLIQRLPLIRPVRTPADFERLRLAAEEDEHKVFFPSHSIEKEGELVGYIGLNSMPLLRMWMHTRKMTTRDCVMAMAVAENMLRASGVASMGCLISRESPFLPVVGKLGWTAVGESVVHLKSL